MGVEGVTNLAFHFFNKIEWSLKIFSLCLLGVEPWKIEEGCFYIVKFKSERTKKNRFLYWIGPGNSRYGYQYCSQIHEKEEEQIC